MKQTKNRRANTGTPQSSTTFKSHNNQPQAKGRRKGQGNNKGSNTPSTPRKSQNSWSSLKTPTRRSLSAWSSSSSKSAYNKGKKTNKTPVKVDQPITCKFWNKCQCSMGDECEYAHFHFKFFHKNSIGTTNTISQYINLNYKNQMDKDNVLIHISQIRFMSWAQVQQITKNMTEGIIQQITSIATLNKNAERIYSKEVKNQRKLDDDPKLLIDQKINAFKQNYDSLVKKNKKDDISQLKNNKNNNDKKDQLKEQNNNNNNHQQQSKNNNKQNIQQQQEKMEEEKNKDIQKLGGSQEQPKIIITKMEEEITQPNKKQKQQLPQPLKTKPKKQQQEHQQKQATYKHTPITSEDIAIAASQQYSKVATYIDLITIKDQVETALAKKETPKNQNNLIIDDLIVINTMYKSKLVQLITNNQLQLQQEFNILKINNTELRRQTKFVIYINAPLLCIIQTQIKNIKQEDASKSQSCINALVTLITSTLHRLFCNEQIIKGEQNMDKEQITDYIATALSEPTIRQNRIISLVSNGKNSIYAVMYLNIKAERVQDKAQNKQ